MSAPEADVDLQAVLKRVADDAADRRRVLAPDALQLPRIPDRRCEWAAKDHYDLSDFLVFHDTELVINAYRALLRREPDETGQDRFVQALRSAELSKVEVVGRIRYSSEGRANDVPVDGLLVPFAIASIGRLPVLGYVIRLVAFVIRLPVLVRNQQRVEATFNAALAQLESSAALENRRYLFTMRMVAEALAARGTANRAALDRLTASVSALKVELGRVAEQARAHHSRLDTIDVAVDALQKLLQEELGSRGGMLLETFYSSFEDHFRGQREDIKRRVAEHLQIVSAARAGTPDALVLDLGCGRGEWLEVLAENGMLAHGIDANGAMVKRCLELGLSVMQADALEHLRNLASESVGAITAFHLIEHLPFSRLIALIEEIRRVLRPGGVMILETPNPENLIVGACTFWYDPTHRKPLPPELMRYTCTASGFADVDITRLHPFPPDRHLSSGDPHLLGRLNELLYGWQDYAVIGYKR